MKVIACVFFALLTLCTATEAQLTSATGIYSSLKYNKDGGDLLGAEIFLLRGGDGFFVVFQAAQGVPSAPVVAPAIVKDGRLTFQLPPNANGYAGEFVAIIFRDRIEGSFVDGQMTPDGKKKFVLSKKKSYWQ